jgi:cysteine-rich CWC protein
MPNESSMMDPQPADKLASSQCADVSPHAEGCEACGGDVACGAMQAGCWCTEIKLSDEMRRVLRERYQHCLCRDCLARFAEEEKRAAHV